MLDWSVAALESVCDRVVVAVPAGREDGRDRVVGGASRSESVLAAVRAAPEASAYVVQDAARPLVTPALVERCAAALEDGWDGAVAATRMRDTVKEADPSGRILRTLDRSGLWSIETPQAFRAEALRSALAVDAEALSAATDDAALVEAKGGSVTIVEGQTPNLKVTTALDLRVAEELLRERGAGC
jgi:2-C-methyl-D-erythritol 4-phosphate cytidylyltransferase